MTTLAGAACGHVSGCVRQSLSGVDLKNTKSGQARTLALRQDLGDWLASFEVEPLAAG